MGVAIPHFCWPSHIYVVNEREFGDKLQKAKENMTGINGIIIRIVRSMRKHTETLPTVRVSKDISVCIDRIKNTMRAMDHVLYHGQIFAKAKGAKYTFLWMASVKEYLNKLLMNETLRDGIITYFFKIEAPLVAECYEIIGRLEIELDLSKVLSGQCPSISQRKFIPCPASEDQVGVVSPRMFFRMTALRPVSKK